MLVHVFSDTPHHYHPMRQFFVDVCSVNAHQEFWVVKPKDPKGTLDGFTVYNDGQDLINKLKCLPSDYKIVFHGLFDFHIWKKLVFSSLSPRCSCLMWGTELYRHVKQRKTVKERISQVIHALMLRRFKYVFTLNKGDADILKKHLKRTATKVLPYPLISDISLSTGNGSINYEDESQLSNNTISILVGNSAAESNHHIAALNSLKHLANENVKIVLPLNYAGAEDYVSEVKQHASKLFGDKFLPITQMLAKNEYDELLEDVDLTVFSHERQQGLYVVYAMLQMGKPMFLNKSVSSFSDLANQGFDVYASDTLNKIDFKQLQSLCFEKNTNNAELMKSTYTQEALSPKWSAMLNGLAK